MMETLLQLLSCTWNAEIEPGESGAANDGNVESGTLAARGEQDTTTTMKREDESRAGGCVVGTIGLILGLLAGFFFDVMLEHVTGMPVRRGFATDMKSALMKAFVGGVVGLVGGRFLGAYLGRKKGEDDSSSSK